MTDQMPKLVQTRLPVTQVLLKYKGPFFSALLIAFVEGVLIAQLSIIVASHNQGAFLTSLHHSMPALAIVMTTLFLNRFITKWGLFNVFLIALICTQFSNLAYWQFSGNFAGLFVVRFASGLVLGVIFVCMDSWVSLTAPLNQRGLVLGLFGSIGAGGYMCGIAIMNFLPAGDPDLFLICNAVLLLMLLVVKNSSLATDIIGKPMQQQETSTLPDDASLDQKTALSAEGTIEASNVVGDNKLETKTNQQHVGISAMLDSFFLNRQIGLYLLLIGCSSLTVAAVAYEFMIPWAVLQTSPNAELIPMLLTSFALGALVLEGFFGWLSDKFGRVVIMLLTLAGQIFALVISSQVFVTQGIPWEWLSMTFLFGGCMAGFFSVSWAAATDNRLPHEVIPINLLFTRFGEFGILICLPLLGGVLQSSASSNAIVDVLTLLIMLYCLYLSIYLVYLGVMFFKRQKSIVAYHSS